MNRADYNQKFTEILAELNIRQREAVEHIDGPMLVVAGPGTGKTHILSARIGQILTLTDVYAHNILCLTYTEAGVHAMRERLLDFIGPEAHKVNIFTFHSFCNKIIQDNLNWFGKRDAEPISELEKVELIREIIDELPNDHPIKQLKGNPYVYERQLSSLFDNMKAENWSVSYLQTKIQLYIDSLPTREKYIYKRKGKNFVKGDIKQHKIDEETEKMEKLSAAVGLQPTFSKKMEYRKRYDFGDMIQWILVAFKQNNYLLRRYQEQFLYILVDEFQDTNGAQNQILKLLSDYWEQPNIFAVGDDDQSIYEFQGARVKNILDFHQEYDDVKLVVLNENYRSSQRILNSASSLIASNKIRLVNKVEAVDKNLLASRKAVSKSPVVPKIVAYPNYTHEITDIANQIEILKNKEISLNEIVVIYAKHRQAQPLIQLLESKKIAYHTKRKINILQQPIIQNIITILQYIQSEYERPYKGERLLFEMLYIDFFGLSMRDIAQLGALIAKQSLERKNPFWKDFLSNKKALAELELKNNEAINRMMNGLQKLILDYRNQPLTVIVERLINRTGVLHFVTTHEEKIWLMQVISTFLDFVENETLKQPTLKIKGLLNIIDRMNANKIQLGVQQTMFSKEGVQLVTAHSSKGLEFEYVFMLGCEADFWEPSAYRNRYQFRLPDTLTLTHSATEDAEEAARRLFYVAMTRAKEHLHLSFSQFSKDGKALAKAVFVDELINYAGLKIEEKTLSNQAIFQAKLFQLQENIEPVTPTLSKDELDGLLEGFTLSATGLARYLNCPLSFYFENVLRAPSVSSVAAAYGSAVHYALQLAFQKMRTHPENQFPTVKIFLLDFEWELNRQRAYLSDKQFKDRLAFGRKTLLDYYNHYVDKWYKDEIRAELAIKNVEIDGVPINGIVDKIEFRRTFELEVVDYKTGKYRKDKINPPNKKNPNGGDYWRQAVFYKILLENYQNKGWIVTGGAIEYIEPYKNEFKQARFSPISSEDVAIVKEQIKTVYNKIMDHQFSEGCGKPTCAWCNFVQHHHINDRYVSPIGDEMDE